MVGHRDGILEKIKRTVEKLPEKFMAVMGTIAVAATGVGLTGCSTEGYDPNKDVTPDTTATLETPQSTPTADAESQTSPALESGHVMEFYDLDNFTKELQEAKDINEARGIFAGFLNKNMVDEYRIDFNENGLAKTENINSAEVTQKMSLWAIASIEVVEKILAYSTIDNTTKTLIGDKFIEIFTAGQAKESLAHTFDFIMRHPGENIDYLLFDYDENGLLDVIATGTAADHNNTTRIIRNINDPNDPMNYNGANLSNNPQAGFNVFASKIVSKTSGSSNNDAILANTIVISANSTTPNDSNFNKPADEAPNPYDGHSIEKTRYYTPIILVVEALNKNSTSIMPVDGNDILTRTNTFVLDFCKDVAVAGFTDQY